MSASAPEEAPTSPTGLPVPEQIARLYQELEEKFGANRPQEDPAPLRKAYEFAARLHAKQQRR